MRTWTPVCHTSSKNNNKSSVLTKTSIKELEGSAGPDGQAMHDDVPGRLWAEESQAMVMREISKPTLITAMVSPCDIYMVIRLIV
jgi:hypothetical protein